MAKNVWFLKRCGHLATKDDTLELSQKEVSIGRSEEATYCIVSTFISRLHAKFKEEGGTWIIKDCDSLNGIYLNSIKLKKGQEHPLTEGDVIGLGQPTRKMWDKRAHVYKLCLRLAVATGQMEGGLEVQPSHCVSCTRNRCENFATAAVCRSCNDAQCCAHSSGPQVSYVPACLYKTCAQNEHANCTLLDCCSRMHSGNHIGRLEDRRCSLESCDGQVPFMRQPLLDTFYTQGTNNKSMEGQKRGIQKPFSADDSVRGQCTSSHFTNVLTMHSTRLQNPSESPSVFLDVQQTNAENNTTQARTCKSKLSRSSFIFSSSTQGQQVDNNRESGVVHERLQSTKSQTENDKSNDSELSRTVKEERRADHQNKKGIALQEATNFTISDVKVEIDIMDSDGSRNSNSHSPVLRHLGQFSMKQGDHCQNTVSDRQEKPISDLSINRLDNEKCDNYLSDDAIVISDDSSSSSSPKQSGQKVNRGCDSIKKETTSCTKILKVQLHKCSKCNFCHSQETGCVVAGTAKFGTVGVKKKTSFTNKPETYSDSSDASDVMKERIRNKCRLPKKRRTVISSESDSDENVSKLVSRKTSKRPLSDSDDTVSKLTNIQPKIVKVLEHELSDNTVEHLNLKQNILVVGNAEEAAGRNTGSPTSSAKQWTVSFGSPSIPKRMVASLSRFMQKSTDKGCSLANSSKKISPLNLSDLKSAVSEQSVATCSDRVPELGTEAIATSSTAVEQSKPDISVKQELPSSPVYKPLSEKIKVQSDNEYGYTQDDEVILISDDEETYLASSQPSSIKSEPHWNEDNSWHSWASAERDDKARMHEQLSLLGIENVNLATASCNEKNIVPEKAPLPSGSNSVWKPMNASATSEDKVPAQDNQFFPELSQNFYHGDGEDDHNKNEQSDNEEFFPELSQNFYDDAGSDHDFEVDTSDDAMDNGETFFPDLSQNFYIDAESNQEFREDVADESREPDDKFFPDLSQNFYIDAESNQAFREDVADESREPDDKFFPDLSQNFYKDTESDHKIQVDSPGNAVEIRESIAKKFSCKFYSTKLTDPIPMIPKNRKNGVYHSIPSSNSVKQVQTKNDSRATFSRPLTVNTSSVKQPKKRKQVDSLQQLKKKVQKNLGNRIRIPGGGSAIPCQPIKPSSAKPSVKAPKPKPSTKVMSPPRPQPSLANIAMKPLELLKASLQEVKAKSRSTTKMSNRAESRSSAFLTDMCQLDQELVRKNLANKEKLQRRNENKQEHGLKAYGGETSFKIPKAVQNKPVQREPSTLNTVAADVQNGHIDRVRVGKIVNEKLSDATVPQVAVPGTSKKVRFSDKQETRYFEGQRKVTANCQVARVAPIYSDENMCNSPGPNLKPSFMYSVDDVLLDIVTWCPTWLEQQEHNEKPPPVIDYKKLWPTLLSYKSYDDYVQVYKPLLLLETWALITKDWKLTQPPHIMAAAVIEITRSQSKYGVPCANFTCQTLCSHEEMSKGVIPQEGQVVILDLVVQPPPFSINPNIVNVKQILKVFAYIERISKCPYKYFPNSSQLLSNIPAFNTENPVVLTFVLKTKQRSVPINLGGLMRVQFLSYLRPTLRQFQALFHLPRTLLARDILQPRLRTCIMTAAPHMQMQVKGTFNQQQRDVILAVADACSQGSVPKICLLQGPPGTGKSHTTVGIVQQLLFGNDMKSKSGIHPKILLTAPSNSAIDELVIRLIKVKKLISQTRKFKLVRIGPVQQVHPDVREYMLENLVRHNLDARLKDMNTTESVEQELRSLAAQSNALHTKLESVCIRNLTDKIPVIRKELAEIQRKIERLQKQKNFCLPTPVDRHKEEYHLMIEMLQRADVVATTLSSCRQSQMEAAFQHLKTSFSACIVDEATQCIEQLMLLPLMFGITKLILVGDPQQLPATVLSQKAMEFGLHQSLFERLYLNFRQGSSPSPVWMLTTQYRMHPEICRFPSKYFYENQLQPHPLLETKYRHNRFVPYILFDLHYVQEEGDVNNGLMYNPLEAEFIITLLSGIQRNNDLQLTVGIITPYQQQKQVLKNMLRTRFAAESASIEVNTVDGFQGREKDLIILSTVRAKHISGSIGFLTHEKRLCVALTRAKQSFYICGHLSSLEVNSSWRALIHDAKERGHVVDVRHAMGEDALSKYILA